MCKKCDIELVITPWFNMSKTVRPNFTVRNIAKLKEALSGEEFSFLLITFSSAIYPFPALSARYQYSLLFQMSTSAS